MLRVGSSGQQVRDWQQVMLTRFRAYALESNGTPLRPDAYFGYSDRDVQREYQRRTQQPVTGEVSDHDLRALGVALPSQPVLYSVCGTGVPWWVGPDADTARAVEHRYRWQPVGYRAAPFPMATSVKEGRTELIRLINLPENHGQINLVGYSQGAVVVSELWEYDIKPENGRLHHRIDDLEHVVCFGNPMREQGNGYADPGGAVVGRESQGIADRLMVDTPPWWRNYAHAGDIYTDVSGDAGEYMTSIYKVVMGTRMFSGPDSLVTQLLIELPERPIPEVIAMFQAIIQAGMFFADGTGPHLNYSVRPAVDFLLGN